MSPGGGDGQRLFVGGAWVEPEGGHYEVTDPATEETVGGAPEASREQALAACAAAREAFGPWSRTAPEERAAILGRAADLIRGRLEPYALLAQAETGATTGTARGMQVRVARPVFAGTRAWSPPSGRSRRRSTRPGRSGGRA